MMTSATHIPVLLDAVLDGLRVANIPAGRFLDATLGLGGHTAAILAANPTAQVLGFDRDPQALSTAVERLAVFGDRAMLIHASYDQLSIEAPRHGFESVDGILFDLGLSSLQLDSAERGFAFRTDAPLDMRFDPTADIPTAADLVNTLDETELADLLFTYGDEPASRRIARAIVNHRAVTPILTTTVLAELIRQAAPAPRGHKIHPATRSFQALRIVVNDELGALQRTLPAAIAGLKPGGRLAVISFHSLEDRIVKQFFKHEATDCLCPPHQPICTCGHIAGISLVTRKPIEASDSEIATNPRSRSAKLRIIEKKELD
jgi:16S rRNA (cytosine1402-N4)-methyltransferase